jgi:hypothetical protein
LRIQALGAAISRKDWHAVEQAYNSIRDEFDSRPVSLLPDAAAIRAKDAEIRTIKMALEDATTGITAATVEAAIRAAAFEEAAKIAESKERQYEWANDADVEYQAPAGVMQRTIAAAIRAAGEK